MKPSEMCKAAGLKNLAELAHRTGRSTMTLSRWWKDDRDLFLIVLRGVVAIKCDELFCKSRGESDE